MKTLLLAHGVTPAARSVPLLPALVVLLGGWLALPLRAAEPKVLFDVGRVVECRDVTPDDYLATHPDERIIEATLRVSVLKAPAKDVAIEELVVNVRSPERRLKVVGYSPQTELGSEIVEPVCVVETTSESRALEGSLGGTLSAGLGAAQGQLTPSLGARTARSTTTQESYSRLPPKHPLVVAGTSDEQYGAFFKLRATSQQWLEGEREFVCRFAVSRKWRGDWAVLSCRAYGPPKWYSPQAVSELGSLTVLVGLYLEGDAEARQSAERLAEAERVRAQQSSTLLRRHPAYRSGRAAPSPAGAKRAPATPRTDQAGLLGFCLPSR